MNRVKLLATRLYNLLQFRNIYVCPVCAEGFDNWGYSSGYCKKCGRKYIKQDNRFNLCPKCGDTKIGRDFCRTCGHAFMRI